MSAGMFPGRHRVRITVQRKLHHADLIEEYTDSGDWGPCSHFEVGQEFVVSANRPWDMPPGFCGWAWADIQKMVLGMARGGPNHFITCCTDGYRPVLFRLQKIVDQGSDAARESVAAAPRAGPESRRCLSHDGSETHA